MIRSHKEFVTVEIGNNGLPCRIFLSRKLGCMDPTVEIAEMRHGAAVKLIRKQVFARAGDNCELCGVNITEETGELHEVQPRGMKNFVRGEYSILNSKAVCKKCHRGEHAYRSPQWRKRR